MPASPAHGALTPGCKLGDDLTAPNGAVIAAGTTVTPATAPGFGYNVVQPASPAAVGAQVKGTKLPDFIVSTNGNDQIDGRPGNDLICGGEGDDVIEGRGGHDYLMGGVSGAQTDSVNDLGDDTLVGGIGDDVMRGQGGDDTHDGMMGADSSRAGAGTNLHTMGKNSDTVTDEGGTDTAILGAGHDVVDLGTFQGGNDHFFGGDDFDTIAAGDGDDELDGGTGRASEIDTGDGGAGTDACTNFEVQSNCP